MSEPRIPGENDELETFQVGVDFQVSARDVSEARELVDEVLTDTRGSDGWIPPGASPVEDRGIGLVDWEVAPQRTPRAVPEPLGVPDEDEMIWSFRVGVDFMVGARDMAEARALVERALVAEDSDGKPFVTRGQRMIDDLSWGVEGWQPVPARPSQAALVQEKYPGLVNDLAVVDALHAVVDAAGRSPGAGLPEGTLTRIRQTLAEADSWLRVEDPDSKTGRFVFEGNAREAASQLAEGVYRGFDLEDREHAVVVGPSELTPSGRVSAAFPKDRHDARTLDEISQLLRTHTRVQPLTELVRLISRRVETTRREGFPSWVPLVGEPEQAPTPTSVYVGVINWSDQPDVEPTVLVSGTPYMLAGKLARTLYETVQDSNAFAGATDFLQTHPGPSEWQSTEDVQAWLRAWQAETPWPSFWMQRVTLRSPTATRPRPAAAPGVAAQGESASKQQASMSDGSALSTYQVPVDFDVCARTAQEARDLVDEALTGDVAPGMPGVMQQRQLLLADGDIFGVLGWHQPTQTRSTDPVQAVLDERAADLYGASNHASTHMDESPRGRDGHEAR